MNTLFSVVAAVIFSFASIGAATLDLDHGVAPAAAVAFAAAAVTDAG